MKTAEEIKEMIEEKKKIVEMLKAKNWGIGTAFEIEMLKWVTAKEEWEIEMLKWALEVRGEDVENN